MQYINCYQIFLTEAIIYIQVDKVDPVNLQQEKEKLERQQQEGKIFLYTFMFVIAVRIWGFKLQHVFYFLVYG